MFFFFSVTGLLDAIYGDDYQSTKPYVILKGIYALSALNALPAIIRDGFNKSTIFVIIVFSLVCFFSFLACDNDDLKDKAIRALFMFNLPFFFVALKIKDYKQMISYMKLVGYVMITCEFLRVVVFHYITTYSQDVGYNSLQPFIIFCVAYIERRRVLYALLVLISLVLILMSGSRGPLLCAILGLILSIVFVNGFGKRSILTIFTLAVMYMVFSMFKEEILRDAIDLFDSLGVSTRSLEGLLYSDIEKDASRDRLREIALDFIKSHPLWGLGVLNDRQYIYNIVDAGFRKNVWGVYCHNFFLEIMMQFGLVPGFILLCYFFKKIYRRVRDCSDKYELGMLIFSLTIGLFPLLVSRSWFTFPAFYLVIGLLCANHTKRIKNEHIN
jgi:O-antigen ligase